jgi:hypothetical protein
VFLFTTGTSSSHSSNSASLYISLITSFLQLKSKSSYTIDYSVQHLNIKTLPTQAQEIEDHIIKQLISFSTDHLIKFVGAGVTQRVTEIVPTLCSRLWKELDIVPLMFNVRTTSREYGKGERPPLGSRQPSLVNVPGTADTKPADTAAATPPPAAPGAVGNGTTVKHPSLRPTDEQADSVRSFSFVTSNLIS